MLIRVDVCGDALTMIEREQASRVDMLTCTELHGLPANVHANEHLLVDHSPLIRTTAHDFGQESSSTFAMQSEDFPALPGSQSAAPLSLGRDDSLTADNATILKESALRGPIDPDTIQFETSDNNDSMKTGAILSGISLASERDAEFVNFNPNLKK
jgi:hypothetical protein